MRIQLIFFALLANFAAATAAGAVTLTYTGNNYNQVQTSGPTTPADLFTTADAIMGTLTLADALAPNLNQVYVSALSFSFSNGLETFTEANSTNYSFLFSTDSTGAIIEWNINISIFAPTAGGGAALGVATANYYNNFLVSQYVSDIGSETLCGPASTPQGCAYFGDPYYTQSGRLNNSPGVWSVQQPAEVPLPAALPLFLAGISGLGFAARKRRKGK